MNIASHCVIKRTEYCRVYLGVKLKTLSHNCFVNKPRMYLIWDMAINV